MMISQIAAKLRMHVTAIRQRIKTAGHPLRPFGGRQCVSPDEALRKRLASSARWRARDGGFECDITFEDVPIPATCPLLGIPIISQKRSDNNPSIDRILPEKGYIKGNVWIVSHRANRLKSDASFKELRMMADAIEAKIKSYSS